MWVFTLCSNVYLVPFSSPHPEHCIFSAQMQCTPLNDLFCHHWSMSLIYWLSTTSREESRPQVKLWDYQHDLAHLKYMGFIDRRGTNRNGVTAKREEWGACTLQYSNKILRTEPGMVWRFHFPALVFVILKRVLGKLSLLSRTMSCSLLVSLQRVAAPPCRPQPQIDTETGRAEQAAASLLHQQK